MAEREYSIVVNCRNVLKQTEELENIAEQLKQQINIIENDKASISQYWMGEASTSYQKKMIRETEDILIITERLRQLALIIRTLAIHIRDADLAALKVAEERNY